MTPPATSTARPRPSATHATWVFWPSLALLALLAGAAIVFPDRTADAFGAINDQVVGKLGWFYTLSVSGFVVFALWMAVSRFGDIVLSDDEEADADYPFLVWFGMLFAAGMGIGLVFWGVGEPLTFFTDPKPGVTGDEASLARAAMAQVFLHWGFHPWAVYAVVGLAMAYAIHRRGRPVSIRWTLEPLFGNRVKGRFGDAIDVVAVIGTVAGVATSLGFGVQQITAGLVHLGVLDEATDGFRVGLIVAITALATISVMTGLDKGIKILSNVNIGIAGIFLLAVLALGPTVFLLREFVQNIGGYLAEIIPLSFNTSAFSGEDGANWQAAWTVFYWGWWISWAPFVGIFIARISRGRTIREFILGVMLVPVSVSLLWFSVLGGTAIYRQMAGTDLTDDGAVVPENALFNLLGSLPAGTLLSGVAILLVTIFFITSSDSGSLVVDMLASGGDQNPPMWSRVLWSVLEGAVAIGLLLAGGLGALQTLAILTALPFCVVMIAMCVATARLARGDLREARRLDRLARRRALEERLDDRIEQHVDQVLEDRLD